MSKYILYDNNDNMVGIHNGDVGIASPAEALSETEYRIMAQVIHLTSSPTATLNSNTFSLNTAAMLSDVNMFDAVRVLNVNVSSGIYQGIAITPYPDDDAIEITEQEYNNIFSAMTLRTLDDVPVSYVVQKHATSMTVADITLEEVEDDGDSDDTAATQ